MAPFYRYTTVIYEKMNLRYFKVICHQVLKVMKNHRGVPLDFLLLRGLMKRGCRGLGDFLKSSAAPI